jgi:integrase
MKGKNVRVREGFWHFRFNLNGQEKTGNTGLEGTARNRKKAEQYAKDEKRRLAGTAEREKPKPFDKAAAEFLAWCEQVEYRSKPSTAARIRSSFSSAVAFFSGQPVGGIDGGAIELYKTLRITKHGVRDISLRHDLHALSVFFRKYAIKMGWAKSNPVREVSIPSDRDAIAEHVVSSEEEEKYFGAGVKLHEKHIVSHPGALPNMLDLARLMLDQGARPEELLSARKDSLDLEARTLQILGGKTRAARRSLYLTGASVDILERRLKTPGPWLFPSDRHPGQHLTKLACTHDRFCVEAGVSFRIYDFRHTFATRAIQDGMDVPTVAAIMGHSGLRVIYRYVHPTAEHKKDAMRKFEAAKEGKKLRRMK